jgi:DNA helicase-2/ATP-dependent DNA helicase PcrA
MNYLESLNDKQKEAVLSTEGPLLILAGAGAGKTKTITHRILHLIKQGARPGSILAITFTNKAAKEMRERVGKLLEEDRELNLPVNFEASREQGFDGDRRFGAYLNRPFVSTFHALGVHIIRENAALMDLPRHFTIFDKADGKRAIKEAFERAQVDPKQIDPGKIQGIISSQKGECVSVAEYRQKAGNDYIPKVAAAIWEKYEAILKEEKALDFDDLLFRTVDLLKKHPEVLERYQSQWQYVHIDEYQDTNRVQYTISKLLSEKSKNICVVGDIDQNIYSWRGADIKNILNFEKDYPEAKVVLLEENYRSTQVILSAANQIIAKNVHRREKNLFTRKEGGALINVFEAYDELDEADFIANESKKLIDAGTEPEEIAVLYRANFQSRALEEAFLMKNLPYQVLGVRFFERKEVKDVLSYLRGALNPESLGDIKRIINIPARGIGKTTLLKIFSGQEQGLPKAMKDKLATFRSVLLRVRDKALAEKPSETIRFIIKETGMDLMYLKGKEEDEDRLGNIRELATLAARYDFMEPEEGLSKFLEDAALASDQDEMEKSTSSVKLMTVHASKGLEFDYVFITGLEAELFPHKRMYEESITREEAEEERRLFYVAVTRARKGLYLCYAAIRTIFGLKRVNAPSEFIFDIDEGLLQNVERKKAKPFFFIDF